MRLAQPSPTSQGRVCVPVPPGSRPTVASGRAICACDSAMRMSQASAHSRPPPIAKPLMAATVTRWVSARASKARPKAEIMSSATALSPLAKVLRSAPALKNLGPEPVITRARTAGLASSSCTVSRSLSRPSRLKALAGGRLRVTVATPPSMLSSIMSRSLGDECGGARAVCGARRCRDLAASGASVASGAAGAPLRAVARSRSSGSGWCLRRSA